MEKSNRETKRLIRIGGEAGQGIESLGQILAKALVRAGYEVLTSQSAMSRIRGGHNYFSIRTGLGPVYAPGEDIDLLVAFTEETLSVHADYLASYGLILTGENMDASGSVETLSIPLSDLAKEKIVHNVAALGVVSALMGIEQEVVSRVVEETVGEKHGELTDKNLQALQSGYKWAAEQSPEFDPLSKPDSGKGKLALNGNQAIALGAMAAGVNFCSFYPMTPATGVALNLISYSDQMGIVCEQAEDEIAAVNMAIGSSFCGGKSLVPTSGGGFALMSEGISLAGMTETPLVLVLGQRPGPATGLPTRTEQGDLELALYSGHGEFPRAILAPGTVEECFYLASRALDLAERYQTPAIVMTDQYLADSVRSVERFDPGYVSAPVKPWEQVEQPQGYQRYAWSESGVSPRLLPGKTRNLVVADSDEHTPDGHITEDHQVRVQMVNKRLQKLQGIKQEVIPPSYQGPEDPDLLLITWGSGKGAVQEAAERLNFQGESVAILAFSQVWPLEPEHFQARLQQAVSVVCVEGNATGQFANLLKRETGFEIGRRVLRYDGLPLTPDFILQKLEHGKF